MRAFLWSALIGWTMGISVAQPEPKAETPSAPNQPAAQRRETTLTFPKEGERWWWAENAEGKPLNAPQKTRDTQVNLKLPEQSATLWVYDAGSGNLAQFKVATLGEKIELTSDRWTHVARLQVNLVAQEKPVASALVHLTDAQNTTQIRALEPSAEGVLVFERVPLGKVTITAHYGEDQKASVETTLKAERELRVPVIELTLTGEVATLELKTAAGAATPEQTSPASRFGAIVMFLIALVLAVGVILFLVRLALQKPQQLGEAMSKLGVELPPAPSGGAGATVGAAQPSQPELPPLDAAGVPPTTPATAFGGAGPASRIVATQGPYAGQAFEITGDLITIGREPVHPIALVNDMGVSRTHAQIIRQGDQTLIEDLGSTNGTYVNGVRISAPTPLKPGDTLQLGASLFKVE